MQARERIGRLPFCLRWMSRTAALGLLLLSFVLAGTLWGQDVSRKVVARTAPSYPELAKRMHQVGKVKVEVVITRGGTVTSAKLVGGNPVFEKSAVEAVKQWRFEAADKETKAVILLEFAEP